MTRENLEHMKRLRRAFYAQGLVSAADVLDKAIEMNKGEGQ